MAADQSSVVETIAAEDPVLTLAEAASLLRIHPSTAKKMAARGELPGVLPKLGGQWRVSAKRLHAYLAGESS